MKDKLETLIWVITVGVSVYMIYLFGSYIVHTGYSDTKYRYGVHAGPQDSVKTTDYSSPNDATP